MRPILRDTPLWAFAAVLALSAATGAAFQYGPTLIAWLAMRPPWWLMTCALSGLVIGLGVIGYLAIRLPRDAAKDL